MGYPTTILEIKQLTDSSTVPTYGSELAAGIDLYADVKHHAPDGGSGFETITIKPGERKLIKTGIAVSVPPGHYGRVAPRSGLAYKSGMDVMAGVIDEDYRGDVGVILINLGDKDFIVHHGDRIAQLITERCTRCVLRTVDKLSDTARGAGKFGSTGK